jgi:Sulfotransferase family
VTAAGRRVLDLVPDRVHQLLPTAVRADLRYRTGLGAPGDLGFYPIPPAPATGERTGPPDFAMLGAADAGSRWWLSLVADHPDVTPGHRTADAAHFFAPYCTEAFGPAEVAAFHAWFPRRPGRIIGYWCPDGVVHSWIPRLLARAAPRTRVLLVVRDPVERLLDGLDRTIDQRPLHPGSYLSDAVDRGFYADQVSRLLESFTSDQVLVLQYEQCIADPAGWLARTFEFLGVDPTYRSRPLDPPFAPSDRVAGRLDRDTRHRLRELYSADAGALGDLVSDLDLGLWPGMGTPE